MTAAAEAIARFTRWVDDFPAAGVRFADLTPVFTDGPAYRSVLDELAATAPEVDLVAGIDARGFLLGAGVATTLGTGVLAVRKRGKLPPPVRSKDYALEYGTACLEIPSELSLQGRRILVVDDVLATGGTLLATAELLAEAGADVVALAVVLEIAALGGRDKLADHTTTALVTLGAGEQS